MDSGKARTDRPRHRRMLEQVGVVILRLSAQAPLRALRSLCSAEPGPGRGRRFQLCRPSGRVEGSKQSLPAGFSCCLRTNGATLLIRRPHGSPSRTGEVGRTFPGRQFRALPAQCRRPHPSLLPWSSLRPAPEDSPPSHLFQRKFTSSARKSCPSRPSSSVLFWAVLSDRPEEVTHSILGPAPTCWDFGICHTFCGVNYLVI